jgi:hypothetical protein
MASQIFGTHALRVSMALMAASRESEPHEVHVYCDEDGNMQIMTFPVEDKVIWHKNPEELEV